MKSSQIVTFIKIIICVAPSQRVASGTSERWEQYPYENNRMGMASQIHFFVQLVTVALTHSAWLPTQAPCPGWWKASCTTGAQGSTLLC